MSSRDRSTRQTSSSGYLIAAGEVDRRPFFLPSSRSKRRLLGEARDLGRALEREPAVIRATAFRAILLPRSGVRADTLKRQPPRARYDVVLLVEATSPAEALSLRATARWEEFERSLRAASRRAVVAAAKNVRRIGPVEHTREGVYLFNYFVAEDTDRNLAVWEETSAWFERETGLDNSEVLLPLDASSTPYSVINHCRWDGVRDILVPLLFKRSVRSEVLERFRENKIVPMPVLYRRA